MGSTLDDLIARVQAGEISAEDAAREAPLHRGDSIGVAIRLSGNVDGMVRFLEANGASNISARDDYIEAYVPVLLLAEASKQPGVIRVRPIQPPEDAQSGSGIPGNGPAVHGSIAWNQAGYTGRGIRVGVIDGGFGGFANLMGTELPGTVHARCYPSLGQHTQDLEDCRTRTHGTAVAESVMDIAPDASLYISDPQSLGDLRDAVDWMISEGVSVINHSRTWPFDGPGDGTSPSSISPLNTVDRAVAAGIVWVNAAGNSAQHTWFQRGPFSYSAISVDGEDVRVINFEASNFKNRFHLWGPIQLRWDDTWGGATRDLDLLLVAPDGSDIALASIDPQSGEDGHYPYERVSSGAIFDIMVANRGDSEPGWIQLLAWKGRGGTVLTFSTPNAGSTTNPAESASPGMLTVGAARWSNVDSIESYSSRGPTPDGRIKPDLVGADCGQTAASSRFCGTSQAAPHVAGLAALVRQRFPGYSPAQAVSYLKKNAEQRISSPDPNNTWGHGFIVLPPPAPQPTGSPSIQSITPAADSLAVEWSRPSSDGGSAITTYDLRRIETSADETVDANWTVVQDVWIGSGALSYELTGLTAGTQYDVQVRAVNSAGDGPWSATVAEATTITPPGAPTGLTATANGQARIDLSWAAPSNDGGSAITGYRIEISEDGSGWSDLVGDTRSSATSYSHTGLAPGITRHYRVSAINSAGAGNASNAVNAATDIAPAPDLVVDTFTVDTSAPVAGASFTLSAMVRNQGNGQSDSTTLRYYQSADATITTSDTEIDTDSVSGLDASGSEAESASLTAPSTPGVYFYGACVDGVNGEPDTTNNCSLAVIITVGAAPAPDLVVDLPTVDTSALTGGASFTLSATVRNQGNGQSDSTTLRYYQSADATITTSDTEIDTDSVFQLDASESEDESVSLTAPSEPGAYYYGACVEAATSESDTTNNCSTAVTVTVGTITMSSRELFESSIPAGYTKVTLSDSGSVWGIPARYTTDSDHGTVAYMLMGAVRGCTFANAEADLQSIVYLKTEALGSLTGYEASTVCRKTSAQWGTWNGVRITHLRFYDEDAPGEVREYVYVVATGEYAGGSVTVTAPDLVVDPPTVSDNSPPAGTSFTLSATVRNQGSGPADSTTLRYYQSTDATITTGDTEVGTDSVSGLDASQSGDESISLTAPSDPGTYYYGACVDAVSDESDTTNNCSSAVTVTVGAAPAPDLVVDTPTVSDNSPPAGTSFTLSATVRNQGSGPADSTTLRYYQSTDATITTGDTEVGTDSVSGLDASQSGDESISLTAPSDPGTYYYGACVDAVSDESDTTNNCSLAVTVTVGAAPAPDLVVDTPTVSESAPAAGARFTLNATVRNQGSGPADSTTLRYYRSTDGIITNGDTEVGTDSVSSLDAAESGDESISLTAPSDPGTYYYGACVDAVSGESDATNNCLAAVAITVGAAPAPDLVVDTPTVSESAPAAGARFTLNATVRNQGSGPADSTTLRYYRSTDGIITNGDTEVGTDSVSSLDAAESGDESISLTAPATTGTYYYGACVDPVSESDTQNNCSAAVTVTVRAAPDNPANQRFNWQASTIVVSWDQVAGAEYYNIYYDDFFDSSCRLVFGRPNLCEELAANVVGTSYTHTDPDADANYYWITACNNTGCSDIDSGNPARLEGSAPAPDLVMDAPTVSESAPAAGARITLSATVRNQGNGSADSTTLRYYQSSDSTITTGDAEVGTDSVSSLDASESGDESITLTAPSIAGAYYYGVCVEAVSDESDTTNNCSAGVQITVGAAPAPDLVVDTPTVSESAPAAGARITLSATVRNQGNGSADSTTLRYYQSSDSTITTGDTEVGTDSVSSLDASESGDESIRLTTPSTPGTYYYGACVDAVSDESDTINNCSLAVTVTVGAAPAPDLVVDTPTVSESAPAARARFTLSATVRNQGSGPADSTTLRYYQSSDSTITTDDTEVGTDSVSSLDSSESGDESISLTAPSTPGTYYYGACVDTVSDESDTTNNCSSAVTVNVGSGNSYGVGDFLLGVPTSGLFIPAVTVGASVSSSGGSTTITFTNGGYIELQDGTRYTCQSTGGCGVHNGEVTQGTLLSQTTSVLTSDLIVDPPTVSENAPSGGARFTLSATVRNQGNGRSDSTTLRYYRSTDSTITTGDTEAGTDYVSRLDAAESGDESISLDAPSTSGTYYYGACVEAVSDESDTLNNCSDAVTVTVGAAPAPDLVVDAPTVSESAPAAGASFTLSATVRNQGSGRSDSTTLRYYQSTDSTITTGDTEVGTDSVGGLSAAGSGDESVSLTAPDAPGIYYYGACAEAVSDESDATNNCSAAVTVTVGAAPAPDLVVDAPTVSESAPAAGASFTLRATVRNQRSGPADSTTLRYYQSSDSTITTGDTEVGTDSVSGLDASESGHESVSLDAPSTPGTYYYGACVDAVSDESDAQNNCSPAVRVTVGSAVSVPGSATGLTATANGSTQIDLSWTAPSDDGGASITGYKIGVSTNGSSWSDLVANTGSTTTSYSHTGLMAGSTRHYRVSAINSAGSGPASNVANDTTATADSATGAPDLIVDDTTLSVNIAPGRHWSPNATVRNQGDGSSAPTTLRYYRSADSTITVSDIEVDTGSVDRLVPSGSIRHAIGVNVPSTPGTYYYGACVDEVPGESDTTNNCSSATEVTVRIVNSPPQVVGDIDDLTVVLGEGFRVDISGVFSEPDGELVKNYGFTLRTPGVITGVVYTQTGILSLRAIGVGATTVAVEASDIHGNGSGPHDLFVVTVVPAVTATAPGAPTGLTATADGQTEIDLSWTAPSDDGGTDITGYLIEVSTNGSSWSDLVSDTGTITTGYSHSRLTAGSTRHYRVSAINSAGTSEPSSSDSATTDSPPAATAPDAPTSLTATADDQSEIYLSWTAPSNDGGADITGYGIEVSTNGSNWSDLVADTDSTATSYSHTGLTAGSTRYYRVSAINSAGTSAPSSADSATTDSPPAATAPDAPTGLTATADGQTEIDLSWTAPSDDGGAAINGYKIEVSTGGSSWTNLVADTGSTTTSYSHTGLTAGTTRHYRVSAINSAGTGPASSSDSATTDEEPVSDDTCTVGLIVEPGESCTYPGTSAEFSVDSSGTGRFLFASSGSKIEIRSTNINGVTYTFVASKQSDGNWIVEEVG